MHRWARSEGVWATAFIVLLALAASAEEPAPTPAATPAPAATPERDIEPEAIAIVGRMTELLGKVQTLHYVAESSYDSVQPDGQKIEFGAHREVTARRPDRVRLDTTDRDGSRRTVRYDGKLLSVVSEDKKVYATIARTGTIDQIVDYVHADLGIPMPLSELFSPDLPAVLRDEMYSARYVGAELLGDVRCDHVAFRSEELGVQMWIAQGGAPLPHRIVIDYETSMGEPQFRADFVKWELAGRAPDSLFAFEPPRGFERITFVPRKRSLPAPEVTR